MWGCPDQPPDEHLDLLSANLASPNDKRQKEISTVKLIIFRLDWIFSLTFPVWQ